MLASRFGSECVYIALSHPIWDVSHGSLKKGLQGWKDLDSKPVFIILIGVVTLNKWQRTVTNTNKLVSLSQEEENNN